MALLLLAGPPGVARTSLRLVAGGDVALGRVRDGAFVGVGGPTPLAGVAPILTAADLAIVNLESPVCPAGPPPMPPIREGIPRCYIRLGAPPVAVDGLAGSGLDLVTLANNHAFDCGAEGVRAAHEALARLGITAVGAVAAAGDVDPFAPVFRDAGAARVAVFAATDRGSRCAQEGPQPVARAAVERLAAVLGPRIRAARTDGADLIVVALHWGHEGAPQPSPAQITAARALVDAGADLVVGHHAHVLQPVERRGGAIIAYGLGNLVFDMTGPGNRTAALLEVRFAVGEGERPRAAGLVLTPVGGAGRDRGPTPLAGEEARAALAGVAAAAEASGLALRAEGDRLVWEERRGLAGE